MCHLYKFIYHWLAWFRTNCSLGQLAFFRMLRVIFTILCVPKTHVHVIQWLQGEPLLCMLRQANLASIHVVEKRSFSHRPRQSIIITPNGRLFYELLQRCGAIEAPSKAVSFNQSHCSNRHCWTCQPGHTTMPPQLPWWDGNTCGGRCCCRCTTFFLTRTAVCQIADSS